MSAESWWEPPRTAEPAEFVEALRELRVRTGLSYRVLERRAAQAGDVLPASTLNTALSRSTLPGEVLLVAFLRACGATSETIAAWTSVRGDIAVGRSPVADRSDVAADPTDAVAGPPSLTAGTPDVAAEPSDATAGTPDVTTGTPVVTAEPSDGTARTPDVTTGTPVVTGGMPDVAAEPSVVGAGAPGDPARKGEVAPADRPPATARRRRFVLPVAAVVAAALLLATAVAYGPGWLRSPESDADKAHGSATTVDSSPVAVPPTSTTAVNVREVVPTEAVEPQRTTTTDVVVITTTTEQPPPRTGRRTTTSPPDEEEYPPYTWPSYRTTTTTTTTEYEVGNPGYTCEPPPSVVCYSTP
ncbi:MAG: helix-turn-helix domain-containing protein [Saccharothrix sp.]|nr:helix-turn-helix domain-containing protein [Saccharothrix sp.]